MKRESSEARMAVGKSHYKFWVLTAIIFLAVWSMFTGSLTLKWSTPNLSRFSHDLDPRTLDDLDVLEVEEREKVVKRMWDAYTHTTTIRLPRFWSEAFRAAYEHLVSDVPGVRDSAISEIAKMSLHSSNLDLLPLQSQSYSHIFVISMYVVAEDQEKLSKQRIAWAVAMTDNKNPSFFLRALKQLALD